MARRKVTRLGDLWQGEMRAFVVDGARVLLVHTERGVFAYEDACRHKGVPLSEGRFDGRVLTCAAHGWEYDACTGRGINPENVALPAFPVSLDGEDVVVDVPSPRARAARGGHEDAPEPAGEEGE